METREIISRLNNVTRLGENEWMASCPAHHDTNASLHITEKNGELLMHCFADCQRDDILAAIGLTWKDLPQKSMPVRQPIQQSTPSRYGLTLAEYSQAKKIPLDVLQSYGLSDGMHQTHNGRSYPGVLMPYWSADRKSVKNRWRMRMAKEVGKEPSRFLWEKEGDMRLYGLWRLPDNWERIIIVEGESDCHTLWHAGYPALGLPGAANYKADRDDAILSSYDRIYVHIEKDDGGLAVWRRFVGDAERGKAPSSLIGKLMFFELPAGFKDPSDAWSKLADKPQDFSAIIQNSIRTAKPADIFRPSKLAIAMPGKNPVAVNGQDARRVTSSDNGAKGGRPTTDYIGLANAYFGLMSADGGVSRLRQWRKGWYLFDGRCYRRYETDEFEKVAMAYVQDPEIGLRYHLQPTANVVKNLLANLSSTRYCGLANAIETPWWMTENKSASGWIATGNCQIDLETAASCQLKASNEYRIVSQDETSTFTRPLSPDLFTTFALPYNYDPMATCPKFMSWLQSTLPNEEVQKVVIMLMGLCLVPDTSYNVCFFLSGEAGTGKSTFQTILEALVGRENVCSVALLDFEDKFKLWKLADNLVNIVGELPTDDPQGRLRYLEGIFKDTISGGNINYEKKHENACEAKAVARHIFATNSLPVFFDKSEGIWDRLIIIPFNRRFRDSKNEIRDIKTEIINAEMPGIFNLALTGLAMLRQCTRFPEPAECKQAKEEHRAKCDIENAYLKEFYRIDPESEISFSDAYKHFSSYLAQNGLRPRSAPTLTAAIERTYGIRPVPKNKIERKRVLKGLQANFYDMERL